MRHKVKKARLKMGSDAQRTVIKKLVSNFLLKGEITTTKKKAKLLKPILEKIVGKAKRNSESDKQFFKKIISKQQLIKSLVEEVTKDFKDKTGGYVRILKLTNRDSDGAEVAKIQWARQISQNKK